MTSASEDEISHLLQINSVNVLNAVLIYYELFHYFILLSKMSLKQIINPYTGNKKQTFEQNIKSALLYLFDKLS